MPTAFLYLFVMLAVICLWFLLLKRPIYESIFVAFIVLVAITGTWGEFWGFVQTGLKTSLLYSMLVFVALSVILTKTKILDSAIAIVLALFGRVTGGAGYAAVVASSFLGALSGSGPGNVMATGTLTIPAMKRSGFPAELAANIESTSSYLGNMIPPSANIVAALTAFLTVYPDNTMTTSEFWIICWGVSLWFILHRLLMVFVFCKTYHVERMKKEDIPSLKETLKTGWKGLLLPIIIILPFVLDYFFKATFFTERLGAGASNFSSSILYFIAGVTAIVAVLLVKDKKTVTPNKIAKMMGDSVKTITPAIAACIFGYMIGAIFTSIGVSDELKVFIEGLNMGKIGLCFLLPALTCFMTMLIPGSSVVVLFGPIFIQLLAAVGVNPLLAAAMLPCMCGVTSGMTPPLALGMYAGMSLAESDFDKTVKNDLWWLVTHYALEVITLLGLLPILGL